MSKKSKNTKNTLELDYTNLYPTEIVASYKVNGNDMIYIDWKKPGDKYGKGLSVTPYTRFIKDVDGKYHRCNTELVSYVMPYGVYLPEETAKSDKSSKKDNDTDQSKKITVSVPRSATYTRINKEKVEIVEPLGEAIWCIDQASMSQVNKAIKKSEKGEEGMPTFINEEVCSMFQTHRNFNEEDKKNGVVPEKIGKSKKVPLTDPIARIELNFNKDTGESYINFKDLRNARRRKGKDGKMENVFPDATVDDVPINNKNVDQYLTKGSKLTGIVRADQIKVHNLGISSGMQFGAQMFTKDKKPICNVFVYHEDVQKSSTSRMDEEERNLNILNGMDIPDEDVPIETVKSFTKSNKTRDDAKKEAAKVDSDEEESEKDTKSKSNSKKEKKSKSSKHDESEEDDEGSEESEKDTKSKKNKSDKSDKVNKSDKSSKKDSKKDSKKSKSKKDESSDGSDDDADALGDISDADSS